MDIGLGSSVLELLNKVTGVPGSSPRPVIIIAIMLHSSVPTGMSVTLFMAQIHHTPCIRSPYVFLKMLCHCKV